MKFHDQSPSLRLSRPIFEVAEICGVVRVSNWLEFLHTLLVISAERSRVNWGIVNSHTTP